MLLAPVVRQWPNLESQISVKKHSRIFSLCNVFKLEKAKVILAIYVAALGLGFKFM